MPREEWGQRCPQAHNPEGRPPRCPAQAYQRAEAPPPARPTRGAARPPSTRGVGLHTQHRPAAATIPLPVQLAGPRPRRSLSPAAAPAPPLPVCMVGGPGLDSTAQARPRGSLARAQHPVSISKFCRCPAIQRESALGGVGEGIEGRRELGDEGEGNLPRQAMRGAGSSRSGPAEDPPSQATSQRGAGETGSPGPRSATSSRGSGSPPPPAASRARAPCVACARATGNRAHASRRGAPTTRSRSGAPGSITLREPQGSAPA